MPINISASLLVDYLSCQRKPLFRIQYPELAVPNKEMIMGSAVHSALEKHSDNRDKAVDYVQDYLMIKNITDVLDMEYATKCVSNFFDYFSDVIAPDDIIESRFKIPLSGTDAFMVGKIDRISSRQIFDWKTSRNPPKKLYNDIQFIIYEWAYRQMNGQNPVASYYGALATGTLLYHICTGDAEAYVFEELIPHVIYSIKHNIYPHTGVFTKACFRCPYRDTCLKDGENVVDSRASFKE